MTPQGQAPKLGCPERHTERALFSRCSNYSLESRLPGRPLTLSGPAGCREPSCSEHTAVHLWVSPDCPLRALGQERDTIPGGDTAPRAESQEQPCPWAPYSSMMSPGKTPLDSSVDQSSRERPETPGGCRCCCGQTGGSGSCVGRKSSRVQNTAHRPPHQSHQENADSPSASPAAPPPPESGSSQGSGWRGRVTGLRHRAET